MGFEQAGIYLNRVFDLGSEEVQKIAVGAVIAISEEPDGRQYEVSWPSATLKLSIKSEWADREIQVNGMKNWVKKTHGHSESIQSFLESIDTTVDLVGCVVNYKDIESDEPRQFVLDLARKFNGFVFTHQSFYRFDGSKIVGDVGDPDFIGVH